MAATTSPKTRLTPTCVTCPPDSRSTMIAPHPAKTRPNVPIPSASSAGHRRNSLCLLPLLLATAVFSAAASTSLYHRNLAPVGRLSRRRLRLSGPNKGAGEFPVPGFPACWQGCRVQARFRSGIAAGNLDAHLLKASLAQQPLIGLDFECPGQTAYPGFHIAAQFRRDRALGHHIGDGKAPAGLQHAKGIAQHH